MLDIHAPIFSATELSEIAGIDRDLVSLWLRRGIIEPSRVERLTVRSRPLFSVVAIFRARLTKLLIDKLAISTSDSASAGEEAELAAQGPRQRKKNDEPACALADDGWMHAMARSIEKGKPLRILALISRNGDCWDFELVLDSKALADRFESVVPSALIPVGTIFENIYQRCSTLYGHQPGQKSRRRSRASG